MTPIAKFAPKIIFFDAAGTLMHLPRGVGFHYGNVARRHGFTVPEGDINDAFRSAWKAAPAKAATRAPRPDDDKGWWKALVEVVLDRCQAPIGFARDAFFEEVYLEFTKPGVWELYPEALDVLETLRCRYRLGIISNFDGRLRVILDHWGIRSWFDVLAISSEVGAEKPDPWIFQRASQIAGIDPGAALHVGDDPDCDWRGAAAAGMVSFQLDRPRNSLREVAEMLV
jgi:putative hydrolase of the HAD superfamily